MDAEPEANLDAEQSAPRAVSPAAERALEHIRAVALRYPEAHEEFPWGDQVIKVRGKIFVFLDAGPDGFGISTKLPHSHPMALAQPFARPGQWLPSVWSPSCRNTPRGYAAVLA